MSQARQFLVRVDFNVPRDKDTGEITDDNRVKLLHYQQSTTYQNTTQKSLYFFSHLGKKIKKEEDKAKNDMAAVAPKTC